MIGMTRTEASDFAIGLANINNKPYVVWREEDGSYDAIEEENYDWAPDRHCFRIRPESKPQLVEGGQGRDPEQVVASAFVVLWALGSCILLVLGLLIYLWIRS